MKSFHFDYVLKAHIKNYFIVTAVFPDYEWENGKATDKLKGYKLKTVCPSAHYDETVIKIDVEKCLLTSDEVLKAPVPVTFENLTFSSYFSPQTGKTEYVGKATGMKIIKPVAQRNHLTTIITTLQR